MTQKECDKGQKRKLDESIMIYLGLFFVIILMSILVFKTITVYNNSELVNLDTELNGLIEKKSEYKGQIFILLSGKDKYWSIDHSRNHAYAPSFLGAFIKKGDTILKNSNSDTIIVSRNNTEYLFLIGDKLFNSEE